MPTYAYRCEICSAEFDALRSVEHRETAECPSCNRVASKVLTFGGLHIDCVVDPYYSDALGEYVKSTKHKKELMREKGLEEA